MTKNTTIVLSTNNYSKTISTLNNTTFTTAACYSGITPAYQSLGILQDSGFGHL